MHNTPAVAGQVLVRGDVSGTVNDNATAVYCSGTAAMIFMMQWLRHAIYNAVRGLTMHMSAPRGAHVKAIGAAINCMVATKIEG